jgi:hypothetical protein
MAGMTFHAPDLATTVVIAVAAAAVSMSFTQGSMFEPIRKWIAARNKLLGELAHCFFCMSHWIAFAGVAIYQPRPVQSTLLADLVVAAFFTVSLATVVSGLMFAAFLAAGHTHELRERRLARTTAAQPRPEG